jgi:hypothetical protein
MSDLYILVGRMPVPAPSFDGWVSWCADSDRTVAETHLPDGRSVTTMFAGHDPRPGCRELFDTTVEFVGNHGRDFVWRHATWAEAEEAHAFIVASLRRGARLDGYLAAA